MARHPEEQPKSTIELTDDQWASIQEYLWDQAFQAGEIRSALEPRLAELYEKYKQSEGRILSAAEREEKAKAEEHYWDTQSKLQELADREMSLLETLERVEDGIATADEVLALIPKEDEDSKDEKKLSKRRAAIQEQQFKFDRDQAELDCGAYLLGVYGVGFGSMDYDFLSTDPRRIASGRNRRRLIAGAGIDAYSAEQAFMDVTADTHGGKSRRPGKNSQYYIGTNGKKIRKR